MPPGVTLWASLDVVDRILFATGEAVARGPLVAFLYPATDFTEACDMIHFPYPEVWADALRGCTKALLGYWWLGAA